MRQREARWNRKPSTEQGLITSRRDRPVHMSIAAMRLTLGSSGRDMNCLPGGCCSSRRFDPADLTCCCCCCYCAFCTFHRHSGDSPVSVMDRLADRLTRRYMMNDLNGHTVLPLRRYLTPLLLLQNEDERQDG